jgi:hypothetical protein
MSLASARICLMPWRTIWWSSQISTLDHAAASGAGCRAAAAASRTRVPWPGALSIVSWPPKCPARSRMPITP